MGGRLARRREAVGRVIGLPMRGWTTLTPSRCDQSAHLVRYLPDWLGHILQRADCAIVAVGGEIGTLSEATLAWSTLQTEPFAADLIFLKRKVAAGAALVPRSTWSLRRPGP